MKIKTSTYTSSATAVVPLLAIAAALLLSPTANAASFDVSPDGSPYSIESALAEAGPGDTVYLADGVYDEPIVTVTGGEEGNPLLIEGGRGAVIQGSYGDMHRAVYVSHSWVTIQVKVVRVGYLCMLLHMMHAMTPCSAACLLRFLQQ